MRCTGLDTSIDILQLPTNTSARVYKIIKPKELRELFLPYHTLAPSQAIERILEAKGLLLDEEAELQRQ